MQSGRWVMLSSLAAFCLWAAVPLQARAGEGERIGKAIDQAIGEIRQEFREGFEKARSMVDRMSVVGRVYARLHWDKALYDAAISVEVGKDGVATLHGTVSSEAAKTKAAQLAADTVGVQRVVNDLKIGTPTAR